MTKREYMQQLSRALEGYEQGFVQEISESYEEHFEAGLKSGRSEEEICRELGDIEELLREMGDEVEFKKEERPLPKPVTAIEPVQYSGISKVQLNLFSMDAEISRSCDGELHVYLQSGEELSQYLEEQVEGDTYMVNEKKPMKKQPSLDLASLLRMMRNPTPKLMVELPERIEFLHGKTTSGDLKLDKLNSRAVELETTSGDIQITQMVAEESVIKASSGDIRLEQVNVSEMVLQNSSGDISWQDGQVQQAQLRTVSGDIELTHLNGQKVELTSVSGDIELDGVRGEKWKAETSSADVELSGSEVEQLEVLSSSGGVEGDYYAQNSRIKTSSGDIDVRLNRKDKELQAKVRTVSGSSRIYGQVNLNDSGVEWEKDPERYIRGEFISSSGDIRVL